MKKLFLSITIIFMLSNPLYAEDFTEFSLGYSDWDFDGYLSADGPSIGFSSQQGQFRYGVGIENISYNWVGTPSVTMWDVGFDYGFGDWEEGTPFVGLSYVDSNASDSSGEVVYTLGYGRTSTSEVNYSFGVADCGDCEDSTVGFGVSWPVGDSNNFIGFGYAVSGDIDVISVGWSKKW